MHLLGRVESTISLSTSSSASPLPSSQLNRNCIRFEYIYFRLEPLSSIPNQFTWNGDVHRFFLHSKTGMLSYHEDTLQLVSTLGNDDSSERS